MPPRKDLLAGAFGSEIDWQFAAPLLKGMYPGEAEFVYFIGEPDEGPIKIGRAQHPIKRLRELQTGNPRRLRIERLIYGDAEIERILHRCWQPFAISGNPRGSEFNPQYRLETEWFRADARERILLAANAMLLRQQSADVTETFGDSVKMVLTDLGYAVQVGDTVRRLGSRSGYVETRIRPAGIF